MGSEIHRRKIRRKPSMNEKEILHRLREKAQNQRRDKRQLVKVKEKWLEELNYLKVKFERIKSKDGKIRGNDMFQEDQGNFYSSIKAKQERKGNVPEVENVTTKIPSLHFTQKFGNYRGRDV